MGEIRRIRLSDDVVNGRERISFHFLLCLLLILSLIEGWYILITNGQRYHWYGGEWGRLGQFTLSASPFLRVFFFPQCMIRFG